VADCVKLSEPVVAPPTALESVTEAALPNSGSAFPAVADPWTTTGPLEDWPKTAGPDPPFDSWAEPPSPPLNVLLPPIALAETLTGPLPPIAEAAAVASPPFPPLEPAPAAPPVAVAVAEAVPEAPGVVVMADALAAPPLPPKFPMPMPTPPTPPVALDRLELFPDASVVVVVAEALAGPPLPPFVAPLPPAPPVAKAELVESEGLFAIAPAGPPSPPSPAIEFAPSNEPGITGTITVSAIAGDIAISPITAADKSSFAFISSSPDANGCYTGHDPVGRALPPFFDKRLEDGRERRLCHL
jgi:hypothetical protein